ncbi:hypothetical protein ACPUD8_19985 [Brevibacterium sp. FAM 25378]|uniref:hypothetical protein n=1 Tax=unclassified Brevibacterium TaxID=2614124 RepID=UPI0010920280|nr:hypothetical protein [Brevibacterium sp. S22]TGD26342.1 hypothetical protein EB835_20030 [Brevibacterium sp. S22]
MLIPEFMSPEHVAQMNDRLRESTELLANVTSLGRRRALTYRLERAPSGIEYWTFEASDHGVRFILGVPTLPSDVTLHTSWTTAMQVALAEREGRELPTPEVEITGDVAALAVLQPVLEAARSIATVETRIPEV